EPEIIDLPETRQRLLHPAQLQQDLAPSDPAVLVLGVEGERTFERLQSPGVLLPSQPDVPEPDVQVDGIRIPRQTVPEKLQGPIVLPRVVELVCLVVVLFGAEEGKAHSPPIGAER